MVSYNWFEFPDGTLAVYRTNGRLTDSITCKRDWSKRFGVVYHFSDDLGPSIKQNGILRKIRKAPSTEYRFHTLQTELDERYLLK